MTAKEIKALKETLQTQQKLVHKLYVELEAEREASSTAASEAMSMILRLQEEKAAAKLEASQFKRMTQEKLNHADQVLLLFEDTMRHKDMEIASLHFQLQAYRYKMLTFGLTDSDIQDMLEFGDYCQDDPGTVRRIRSLPAIQFKDPFPNKGIIPLVELSPTEINQNQLQLHGKDVKNNISDESAMCDLSSYWEQIKELDERVNELSRDKSDRHSSNKDLLWTCGGSMSLEEGRHGGLSAFKSDPARGGAGNDLDDWRSYSCLSSRATDPENLLQLDHCSVPCSEADNIGTPSQSLGIYDVFEVPQDNDNSKLCRPQNQGGKKFALEKEDRLGKPDPAPHGLTKYSCKNEAGWIKSPLQYAEDEHKWNKSGEGVNVSCHLALLDSSNGISPLQTHFQQLSKRVGKLEGGSVTLKQGVSDHGELNSRLLKEIHKQLNAIQSEIRKEKLEICHVADEPSLVSLMEEMFFYSL